MSCEVPEFWNGPASRWHALGYGLRVGWTYSFNLAGWRLISCANVWGPVMWVMLGEMFPNQMRGAWLAVSGLAQWFSNFGITMTFPILLTGLGLGAAYGIYATCALVSVPFIYKFVKETNGKQLEEMEKGRDDLSDVTLEITL